MSTRAVTGVMVVVRPARLCLSLRVVTGVTGVLLRVLWMVARVVDRVV